MLRLWQDWDTEALLQVALRQLAEREQAWPRRRSFFIVPESRKIAIERLYLESSPNEALLTAEILSFSRLATRILEQCSLAQPELLGQSEEQVLLEFLLREQKAPEDCQLLARLVDHEGYLSHMIQTLELFERYRVEATHLEEAAGQTEDEHSREKFQNFANLAKAFAGLRSDLGMCNLTGLLDQALALLQDEKQDIPLVQGATCFVIGFGEERSLTPQELDLLTALEARGAQIDVYLCVPPFASKASSEQPYTPPAWQTAVATSEQLQRRFPQIEYRQLEQPSPKPRPFKAEQEQTWRAEQSMAEAEMVAARIHQLLDQGVARCRDIAIYHAAPEHFPELEQALARHGIPTYIEKPTRLIESSFSRFLLQFLELAERGSSTANQTIFSLLKAPFWPHRIKLDRKHAEEKAEGESVCQESGLAFESACETRENLDRWERYLAHRQLQLAHLGDALDKYACPELPKDFVAQISKRRLQPLLQAAQNLQQAKSIHEQLNALLSGLASLGFPQCLKSYAADLLAQGDADRQQAAEVLSLTWRRLHRFVTLLQRASERLSEFRNIHLPFERFCNYLESLLASESYSRLPSGLDEVMVLTGRRYDLLARPYLFILSASWQNLPKHTLPQALLRDDEIALLSGPDGEKLPALDQSQRLQHAYWMEQLSQNATKSLTLSWVSHEEGNQGLANLFRAKLQQASYSEKPIPLQLIPRNSQDPRLWSYPVRERAIRALRAQVQQQPKTKVSEAWQQWLSPSPSPSPSLDATLINRQMLEPELTEGEEDLRLARHLLDRILPRPLVLSPSAVERYVACPWRYLAEYLYRARPWQSEQQEASFFGNITHGILEHFFQRIQGIDLAELLTKESQLSETLITPQLSERGRSVLRESVETFLAKKCEPEEKQSEIYKLYTPGQKQYSQLIDIERSLLAFLPAALLDRADRQQTSFLEKDFSCQLAEISSDCAHYPVALQGRVDRIDASPNLKNQHLELRIIDYKSGSKKVDWARLLSGQDLQLLTYAEFCRAQEQDFLQQCQLTTKDGKEKLSALAVELQDSGYWHTQPQLQSCLSRQEAKEKEARAKESSKAVPHSPYRYESLKLPVEAFRDAIAWNRQHLVQAAEELTQAHFPIQPKKSGGRVPCQYCPYRAACGTEQPAKSALNLDHIAQQKSEWVAPEADDQASGKRMSRKERYVAWTSGQHFETWLQGKEELTKAWRQAQKQEDDGGRIG